MMNSIEIKTPQVCANSICYEYSISGDWREAFQEKEKFKIEYSCGIENVPVGILMIPLLANLLPMSWVYDADIICPVCDKDFFESIVDFKRGYKEMYPMMDLKGRLSVKDLQSNVPPEQDGSVAFFSGGVDAFCTLIRHWEEKPTLITLWGSDISVEDKEGWNKVLNHLEDVSQSFSVDYVVVKSSFRKFLNEGILHGKVEKSGDGWWHGFQHGIGVICHAAPIVYTMGRKTVYFASSFTEADKGIVTCASDPSIDNYVRFCGARVYHDGYELNRQDKIDRIVQFVEQTGIRASLRVCWESKGGSNCCHCEKCRRTILGLYAAGADPREYGFHYNSLREMGKEIRENRFLLGTYKTSRYLPIWTAFRKRYKPWTVDPGLRWFYFSSFSHLEKDSIFKRGYRKGRHFARKVLNKLRSGKIEEKK